MLTCLPVLNNLVYPATLTAIGLVGNAIILGSQIKEAKDELGNQIREVKADLNEVKAEVRDVRNDAKALIARQTGLELQLLKGCGRRR